MKFIICLLLSLFFFETLFAKDICSTEKIYGFSSVKVEKAFFYKEPQICKAKTPCKNKKKSYLVKNDKIQIGDSSVDFVCVIYRNYNGWGGKQTKGWLLKTDLQEIKTKLNINDIEGSWYKEDCGGDESCIVTISKLADNQYEINGTSYLHDHPGMILTTKEVKMTDGKLSASGSIEGLEKNLIFEVIFSNESLEPGTILLKDADGFSGVFYR